MIKDKLANSELYFSLSENIKQGLIWLKENDLEILEDRRYEIEGTDNYVSIQTYQTKNDAKYESHKKYIDIQYIIEGSEKIGVTNLSNCISCIKYDSEKDLEFFDINCKEEFLTLNKGEFLILYPHDAHKPSISIDKITTVKKAVVKVAI